MHVSLKADLLVAESSLNEQPIPQTVLLELKRDLAAALTTIEKMEIPFAKALLHAKLALLSDIILSYFYIFTFLHLVL